MASPVDAQWLQWTVCFPCVYRVAVSSWAELRTRGRALEAQFHGDTSSFCADGLDTASGTRMRG